MTLTAETASCFTIGSRPIISESTWPIFAKFSGLVAFRRRWLLWNGVAIAQGTLPWQPNFVHSIHTIFVIFIHDALDRRRLSVIHEVDRRWFLLRTPVHLGTDISPWAFSPYDIFLTLACDGILQEVQVLRWTHANQLTGQSTLTGGEGDSRVDYSQALPWV